MFELRHEPGLIGFSDFTQLKEIEITIAGTPFEHLSYHYRLGYSGWQYAHIIQVPAMTDSLTLTLPNESIAPTIAQNPYQHLLLHLKQLRLSHMLAHWESVEHQAMQEQWSYAKFLLTLCELETSRRNALRLQRGLTEAALPTGMSRSLRLKLRCCLS